MSIPLEQKSWPRPLRNHQSLWGSYGGFIHNLPFLGVRTSWTPLLPPTRLNNAQEAYLKAVSNRYLLYTTHSYKERKKNSTTQNLAGLCDMGDPHGEITGRGQDPWTSSLPCLLPMPRTHMPCVQCELGPIFIFGNQIMHTEGARRDEIRKQHRTLCSGLAVNSSVGHSEYQGLTARISCRKEWKTYAAADLWNMLTATGPPCLWPHWSRAVFHCQQHAETEQSIEQSEMTTSC